MGDKPPVKYFRANTVEQYETVRSALDAENGYPSSDAETTIEPAATAPRDASGRLLLAIDSDLLSASLGQLEEITADDYQPATPSPDA